MKQLVKKVLFLSLLSCLVVPVVNAQNETTHKIYGFVRTDLAADFRKMYASSLDLFSFYPMYKNPNVNGQDLNQVSSLSLMSITSRFGFDLATPGGIFHTTKTSSKIETDFCGSPTYNLLRIRQAYSQLFWNHSSLLIGQTWHPMSTIGCHPLVLSLNTGALFEPFNRSPQIRFEYEKNQFKATIAAIYQMQYTSVGPDETIPTKAVSSYSFQRNSLIPNMYIGGEYKDENLTMGLGLDWKSILPERYITNLFVKTINYKTLETTSAMLFAKYESSQMNVRFKTILGQNLSDHSMIGGYAITSNHEYIPFDTWANYLGVTYGKTVQGGLFLGYTENLGSHKKINHVNSFYGFGIDKANDPIDEKIVKSVFRITPTITYKYKQWVMGAELEHTVAEWGSRKQNGDIQSLENVSNNRINAILTFNF